MIPIMFPSRAWAMPGKHASPGCHAGTLALVWCLGMTITSAQVPTASREELMRQWDVNRDGKVDTSEAEIARGRMRRARAETMMNSGNDPVTGRLRAPADPVTGRPLSPATASSDRGLLSSPSDDDGLILVPGNGEGAGSSGRSSAGKDMPPRPSRRDGDALPGTVAPSMSSTIPSVSPRLQTGTPSPESDSRSSGASSSAGRKGLSNPRDAGGSELSSRARLLPGMSSQQNLGGRDPQSLRAGQEQQYPGARPGVISGGVRASGPGARPGVGAAAPPGDLNAGRLPGGLPQTRGINPGAVAGPRLGPMQQPNSGRLTGSGLGPSVP